MSFKRMMKRKKKKEFNQIIMKMVDERLKTYTYEEHVDNYKKFLKDNKIEDIDSSEKGELDA